jgi:hypothetical protein
MAIKTTASGKRAGKPVRWERLLMVLANGGVVTLEQIQKTMQYDAMYRIGAELLNMKYRGAVIKAHKNGRKVVGYELINVAEMLHYLTDRGFGIVPIADASIKNLGDLKAKKAPAAPVTSDDEVVEITE